MTGVGIFQAIVKNKTKQNARKEGKKKRSLLQRLHR
jgi:hypothetical protein